MLRLATLACEHSFGIFGSGPFVWELPLGNDRLGLIAQDPLPAINCLGAFACHLPLENYRLETLECDLLIGVSVRGLSLRIFHFRTPA